MGTLERVPGKQNWIEHLPGPILAMWHRTLIYRAAVHMANDKAMPVSKAIPSAINWCHHIALTGDVKQWPGIQNVNAISRAEAIWSMSVWEMMKATNQAQKVLK
jgi:hypothetical protein